MPRSPTSSRRRKEKEDRKDAILGAARAVFFEQGIRRATVDEIAARAEVAKGTVYLYFESRETILAHLLLEGLAALDADLERAYAEQLLLSADARLRQLAAAYLRFYQAQQDYFRLMMAFDRGHFREVVSPELYEEILQRSQRGLRWVVRAFEQGAQAGELGAGDPRQSAGMLWAALNGVLVLTSHPLRRELLGQPAESLYAGVLDTMLRGLHVNSQLPGTQSQNPDPNSQAV